MMMLLWVSTVSGKEAPGSEDAHFAAVDGRKKYFLRKKEKPEAVLPEAIKS